MTDWTPGPWRYTTGPALVGRYHTVDDQNDLMICECSEGSEEQQEANARLIAAAPDLYAALEALEPHLDAIVCYASTQSEHEPNRLVANVKAALLKARGETE